MNLAIVLSPFLAVGLGSLGLMLSDALSTKKGGFALGAFAILLAAALLAAGVWLGDGASQPEARALAPWLLIDGLSLYATMLLCAGGALSALLAGGYLAEHRLERGEFHVLLLLSVFGAMTLAAAGDALTLFLGLETMSLGVYCLTAFRRQSARSVEGGLECFLLSSFAAALLLYGFALIYGATGHTDLAGIGAAASTPAARSPLFVFGAVLVLVGLAFKVSAVPFHAWTPDAYEGASDAGDRAHGGDGQGRGIRDSPASPASVFLGRDVDLVGEWLASGRGDSGGRDDDGGQSRRESSGLRETDARLLEHRACGYILVGLTVVVRLTTEGQTSVLFYLLAYAVSTARGLRRTHSLRKSWARGCELRRLGGTWQTPSAHGLRVLDLSIVPRGDFTADCGIFCRNGSSFSRPRSMRASTFLSWWLSPTASSPRTTTFAFSSSCTCANHRGRPCRDSDAIGLRAGGCRPLHRVRHRSWLGSVEFDSPRRDCSRSGGGGLTKRARSLYGQEPMGKSAVRFVIVVGFVASTVLAVRAASATSSVNPRKGAQPSGPSRRPQSRAPGRRSGARA